MYSIRNISCIYFGKSKGKQYFVIEDSKNTIILNLTKGREENNLHTSMHDVEYIYKDGSESQEAIELDSIAKVSLLSNVDLINEYTKKNISSPYLLCIEDKKKNKLYVDIMFNIIYTRIGQFKLKKYSNTKIRNIYSENQKYRMYITKFKIRMYRIFNAIFEIEDEENTV